MDMEKRYLLAENNRRLAVEIDDKTILETEEVLEDNALYHLLRETGDSESLALPEARSYYRQL